LSGGLAALLLSLGMMAFQLWEAHRAIMQIGRTGKFDMMSEKALSFASAIHPRRK